jgi:cysteine desulfurase
MSDSLNQIIYLDYAATSPIYDEVINAMLPFLKDDFGNASSEGHPMGWFAKEAVENARERVAQFIRAKPHEVFFTSGATESINWGHQSFMRLNLSDTIISQPTEHNAVLQTCRAVAGKNFKTSLIDQNGRIDSNSLEQLLKENPFALVSVMTVNNETGAVLFKDEIADLKNKYPFTFFCDATQSIGKLDFNTHQIGCDMMAFSAHKLGGPKGCGVLYIQEDLQNKGFFPFMLGGSQEYNLRAGTVNVPAVVGLAKAIELSSNFDRTSVEKLRLRLEVGLESGGAQIIGKRVDRAPHITSFYKKGLRSEEVMMRVNHKLALANGSACNSRSTEPSHVFKALGMSNEDALSCLRISIGYKTTESEIDYAVEILSDVIRCHS